MDTHDLDRLFSEVKAAYDDPLSDPGAIYLPKIHVLAEAQYLPAKDFFYKALTDSREDWREYCLSALGFHYDITMNKDILQTIREMLLKDNEEIRMIAASVLGSQSHWPDPALVLALKHDDSVFIRFAAFISLLKLAGVPYIAVRNEVKKFRRGEIVPSVEYLNQVLKDSNIDLSV
jgi:hypothetical protein